MTDDLEEMLEAIAEDDEADGVDGNLVPHVDAKEAVKIATA